jgi:hypothetical protein
MASAGPNSPDSAVDDSGIGTIAWSTPGNVLASDNSYAQANITASGGTTHYVKATDFDFTIPSGATIDGIIVEVERRAGVASAIEDEAVRIVKGDTIGSTDRSSATLWPNADTYETYGSASDLWGETWTDSDINSTGFGFAIACQNNSANDRQARIDHIQITVHYTEGGGGSSQPPRTMHQFALRE